MSLLNYPESHTYVNLLQRLLRCGQLAGYTAMPCHDHATKD